jgi:hypothetical protein
MIKMNSIVEMIGLIKEEDGEAGIAAARGKTCSPKSRISKRETSPRAGSDYHLGMLSAPRALMDTEEWPDYEFDTQLGKGQTIYLHHHRNLPQRVALSTAMSFRTLSRFRSLHSSHPTTSSPQKT